MYGQPIQFKYKNSFYYPTNCGVCISIFVIIIIIIYLILVIIDITKMNTPTVLNVPESISPSPLYNFIPDYIGFFDNVNFNPTYLDYESYKNKLPSLFKNKTDFGYQQFMFGIKKGNEWVNINNSIFNVMVYNYIKGEQNQLFFSKCKRVPHVKETMFNNYNLSQVYCIYSPIQISQSEVHVNYSYVKIIVKKCEKNETYYKSNLSNFTPYNNLKNLVNGNLNNENIESEAYINEIDNKNNNSNNTNNPITCSNQDEIENIIKNYKFYFIYISSIFNQTEKNEPIVRVIDWKYTSFCYNMTTDLNAYFQINSLKSYKSVIPNSMGGKNETETFVSFDNEKYSNTPDDSENNEILSINIKSSDIVNNYERTYITIFEIIGQVGGLSKFIIILGSFFFLFGKLFDFEESMINDFYHVVDPKYNDKTQRNFEEFLDEISNEKYNENIEKKENKEKEEKKENKEKEEKKENKENEENEEKENEENEEKEKEENESNSVEERENDDVIKNESNESKLNEENENEENSKIQNEEKEKLKINQEEKKKNLYVNEKEKIFINFFREKLTELQETKTKYYSHLQKKNENEIKNNEEKKEDETSEINTNKKNNNSSFTKNKLSNHLINKKKAKYNILKLLYGIYINQVYSGLHFTIKESYILKYFWCCASKELKDKNKVFKNALNSLKNDTDFLSILEYVQNFESLKKTFLKRETQLALFKALANKPFYSIDNEKNYRTINMKKQKKQNESESEKFRDQMKSLYDNLFILVSKPLSEEDLKLEKELLFHYFKVEKKKDNINNKNNHNDYNEYYEKTIEELINNLEKCNDNTDEK